MLAADLCDLIVVLKVASWLGSTLASIVDAIVPLVGSLPSSLRVWKGPDAPGCE